MVTVPHFDDEQQRGVSRARVSSSATAEDFGVGIGRGLQKVAAGLDDAATFFDHEDERINQADARERDVIFSRFERDTMSAPDTGYLNATGRTALERYDATEKTLKDKARELLETARSGRSQTLLDQSLTSRMESTLGRMAAHRTQQATVYEDQQREAQVLEAGDNAVSAYADDALVRAHIDTGLNVIEGMARDKGWSAERLQMQMKQFSSQTMAGVIAKMANDNPAKAGELYEKNKGGLTAGDASSVYQTIHAGVLADQARQTVEELMPKAGGDIAKFLVLADNIQNTELRDEVIARGYALSDQGEKAEARNTDNAEERARSVIDKSGFGGVSADDRALLIREGRWNGILGEYRALASGGKTEFDRSSQILGDQLAALSVDNPRGFGVIADQMRNFKLPPGMDEAGFQASTGMSVAEARALRDKLNADDWSRVRDARRVQTGEAPITAGGQTLIEKTYDDIRTVAEPYAESMGVNVTAASGTSKPSEDLLKARGQFRAFIMREAREFVTTNNRAPTTQEVESIAKRAMRKGKAEGDWWGEKRAFEGDAKKAVIVPWKQIPETDQKALVRAWRTQNPGQTPSKGEVESWAEQAYGQSLAAR